jgi:hypothetical protein
MHGKKMMHHHIVAKPILCLKLGVNLHNVSWLQIRNLHSMNRVVSSG